MKHQQSSNNDGETVRKFGSMTTQRNKARDVNDDESGDVIGGSWGDADADANVNANTHGGGPADETSTSRHDVPRPFLGRLRRRGRGATASTLGLVLAVVFACSTVLPQSRSLSAYLVRFGDDNSHGLVATSAAATGGTNSAMKEVATTTATITTPSAGNNDGTISGNNNISAAAHHPRGGDVAVAPVRDGTVVVPNATTNSFYASNSSIWSSDVNEGPTGGSGIVSRDGPIPADHEDEQRPDAGAAAGHRAGLTVVISTYKQPACLKLVIDHLQTCSDTLVAEIRVNWFEGAATSVPDPYNNHSNNNNTSNNNSSMIPVIYDVWPDKLSYRFHPRDFVTDAVFSADVDRLYSCEALQLAYDTWCSVASVAISDGDSTVVTTAVGFHPRHLTPKRMYRAGESYRRPRTDFIHNTVFTTQGGVVHKDAYEIFFHDRYESLRRFVDEYVTGEDILMSWILATSEELRMRTTRGGWNDGGANNNNSNHTTNTTTTRSDVIAICLEEGHSCLLSCQEQGVKSLAKRTANHRWPFIRQLYNDETAAGTFFANTGNHSSQGHSSNNKSNRNNHIFDPFAASTKRGAAAMVWQEDSGSGEEGSSRRRLEASALDTDRKKHCLSRTSSRTNAYCTRCRDEQQASGATTPTSGGGSSSSNSSCPTKVLPKFH